MLDLDALAELAERLGATGSEVRFEDLFPGYRRFCVDDCLGNRLEFMSRTGA